MPTSLCSGQIAGLAARQLAKNDPAMDYATLIHTEGCGVAFASTREIYAETMVGYADHPLVNTCLFLEHGCEKAHNDYLHSLLAEAGLEAADFGWASVQLDGGIQNVLQKIKGYFAETKVSTPPAGRRRRPFTLALMAEGTVPAAVATTLAQIAQQVVAAGGSVVVANQQPLIQDPLFRHMLGLADVVTPSLAYGQAAIT
ncbi:MAG: UxaA family hydrolase, partial [Candidatus Competibacteraceae bacterium]|nr:UxaA family hydrolase [Candidatus Competibacteraceae bacterium]